MIKNTKKRKAFTLAEAMIVMVILGIIAAVVVPQLKTDARVQANFDTLSQKMSGYLTQAASEILTWDASLDDYTRIKLGKDSYFSIEDEGAEKKLAFMFQKYLNDIQLKVKLDDKYFNAEVEDFNRNPLGFTVGNTYKEFFYTNDGMLLGFKLYGGCDKTELYASPSLVRQYHPVNNICGSVFYDINGFKQPNRLGADQYILPIGRRGFVFEE